MIKISKEIIEKVFELYKVECQYLIKAELDYPIAKGIFKIPRSFYTKEGIESGHFNATDMMICYNQLAFAFFIDSIQRDLIQGIEKNLSLERRFQEGLIIGMNNIKFRKPINPKEFEGKIKLEKIIPKRDDLIFFNTSYDFENGKATGNVDLAFFKQ